MMRRKDFPIKPTEIRHDFGKFAGELCPICRQNRLVAVLRYPICNRCRKKLDLTEDLLESLSDRRLIIDQDTIDWQQQPHSSLTGTLDLDGKRWEAFYVFDGWSVQFTEQIDDSGFLACLLKQYLDRATPGWLEQAENKQTKIRRYVFFVTAGTTVVTAAYFVRKCAERLKKELQEAEEAEGTGKKS